MASGIDESTLQTCVTMEVENVIHPSRPPANSMPQQAIPQEGEH